MALTTYMEKQFLDWCLGGATATQPTGRFLQWATGSPNTDGASDGPFVSRVTCTFAAANSPQGTVTNVAAVTGATGTAAATVVGWNLYDAAAAGNRLAFGTLAAALGCKSATDSPCFSAGALKIVLS